MPPSIPSAASGPSPPSSGHAFLSQAQFPSSVASSFILASSAVPTATVPETHQTGLANSQTSSGSGNGSTTGSSEQDFIQPPAGATFGDLLAEPMQVSSGQKKEKKKKKKTRSKGIYGMACC